MQCTLPPKWNQRNSFHMLYTGGIWIWCNIYPKGVQNTDKLKKPAKTGRIEFNFWVRFQCNLVSVWIFWNQNISVSVLVLDFFTPKPTEPTNIYIYIYIYIYVSLKHIKVSSLVKIVGASATCSLVQAFASSFWAFF